MFPPNFITINTIIPIALIITTAAKMLNIVSELLKNDAAPVVKFATMFVLSGLV